ncbi:MAG: DUF2235 domain-containing protein [Roseobacter sp.]
MAHIAIFCDGTWNSATSNSRTHVHRLSEACAQSGSQKVMYFPGVGTGTGMISDVGRWLNRFGGGVFGWGLNRNIRIAYQDLCELYQPGDKIMIFGFSRGAYTARSLVGLVRKCGILKEPTPVNLRRAFKIYRARGDDNKPDSDHIWQERRSLSPDYATSAEDVIRRNDHSYLVRITYVGVFDTVGALGVPTSILGPIAKLWNGRYSFHDTSLSSLVEQARHAVALDEKRVLFEPSLWGNLRPNGDDPGLNRGDESDTRPYQQVWFAGNHSVIGGSSPEQGLAAASVDWIWQGAHALGLKLDPDYMVPNVPIDVGNDAPEIYELSVLYRLLPWLNMWRDGPTQMGDLHDTVRERATRLPNYRPKTIARVLPEFFQDS